MPPKSNQKKAQQPTKVNQSLVILQKAGKKKKGNKARQVTNGVRMGYNGIRNNFLLSLVSPFCPEAYGTRVPDPFPFPTVTHHIRQTTVLGSNSSGNGAVVFLPSPTLSLIDISLVNGSGASIAGTPMTRFGASGAPFSMFKATTVAAINAIYGSYRTVSWGIKISNLQPELSATGRIIIAMIPVGDSVPSENELSNVANTSAVLTPIFGTPTAQLGTSGILQLPSAQLFAVQDLLHGDLEVSGMYTNTSFWQFKTTETRGAPYATHAGGDSFSSNTSTGLVVNSGYKDVNRMPGGCAIAIFYEGVPASIANSFQIETIYHIEGSPQISATASTIPVPSGAEKAVVGTTDVVDQVMGVASKLENVFTFITKGADFLNRNSGAIDKLMTVASTAKYLM